MILVYLWIPFIILALAYESGIHSPIGQAHIERHGFRQDRAWILGLAIGFLGPLILLYIAVNRAGDTFVSWLRMPIGIPFGAFKDGARTEADLEKMMSEVRAGERPCFVRPFPCGCCGRLIVHAQAPESAGAAEEERA